MTESTPTAAMERRQAARVVDVALRAVLAADVVSRMREDSPLVASGMTDADAVCVVDALAAASAEAGWACVLDDAALIDVVTVADLIDVVTVRASQVETA